MEEYAKLLNSIAALVGAVAWPMAVVSVVLMFRRELTSGIRKIIEMLDRMKKASVAGIVIELERVANSEVEQAGQGGNITPEQRKAAARITVQARGVSDVTLLDELDGLCLAYDALRRELPAGTNRTREMTRVVVKMRALAPSVINYLDVYKGSGSPGSRLAAVAMMQMVPRLADVNWLRERFSVEKPFVFYHAALALQNVANIASTIEEKAQLRQIGEQALATVNKFGGKFGGTPDRNTVDVLNALIGGLRVE
jgi:hypothetical protein